MLLRRPSRARLALAACVLVGGAAVVHGDARHVQKRTSAGIRHFYWIDPGSGSTPGTVSITALPPALAEGDVFDVIDDQGYWGRVVVASVETIPFGCRDHYLRGLAQRTGDPKRPLGGARVAIGPPPARPPLKARFVTADAAGPDLPRHDQSLELRLIDLDGDGDAELARSYFYCQDARGRTGNCVESYVRAKGGWTLLEKAAFGLCN
jgi:hypothetical protein